MTLKEFQKNGFVTGRPFEVEGRTYWVEKTNGGRYFDTAVTGKYVSRATASTVCKLIEQDVRKYMQG